MTGNVQGMSGK